MIVLVTGGTGAVGINIVRVLAEAGHEVLCLSRSAGGVDAVRDRFLAPVAARVRMVGGDVGDLASLDAIWARHHPTHVVHAAAITPTADMERTMAPTIVQANLMGTVNVLEAVRRGGARRVAYVSSAAVYGEYDEAVAIDEAMPVKPWGLYGISKDASEKLCAYHAHLHGTDVVALRVGWVYGPMERPMAGSRLSMSLAYECVRLALAGEEIRLAHLDHVRDWIHAEDLGRAVLAVLDAPALHHRVYNLAGDRGITHRALLGALDRSVRTRYRQVPEAEANVPPRQTQKRRGPLSIARLLADTAYRPRFSLDDGLRQYVGWVQAERQG
jgi:nucleoside-diphosphate-sugar epimerase